jgi:hypothetical protein
MASSRHVPLPVLRGPVSAPSVIDYRRRRLFWGALAAWASTAARSIRAEVFATFAAEGRPPTAAELSGKLGLEPGEVGAGLRELHDAHAVVLTAEGDAIRMAHPFSAWPMGFVVRTADRLWWGGCAWDSFGIVAALGERLEILTTCPGCGRDLRYNAGPADPPDTAGLVVRVPRPARKWWDDVVATCTEIRAFCDERHLHDWVARTGEPEGAAVALEQLWRLALPWYGDRLDPDWKPRPLEASQALLEEAGLSGPFWRLPSP